MRSAACITNRTPLISSVIPERVIGRPSPDGAALNLFLESGITLPGCPRRPYRTHENRVRARRVGVALHEDLLATELVAP